LLLAILNTDAPTLLRMRVWIPALGISEQSRNRRT